MHTTRCKRSSSVVTITIDRVALRRHFSWHSMIREMVSQFLGLFRPNTGRNAGWHWPAVFIRATTLALLSADVALVTDDSRRLVVTMDFFDVDVLWALIVHSVESLDGPVLVVCVAVSRHS
jgi:hypothetical protein